MSEAVCRYCGDTRSSVPKVTTKKGAQCENTRACTARMTKAVRASMVKQ